MESGHRSFLLTALYFWMLMITGSTTFAQEFLSIDCGAVSGKVDEEGIEWVTDDEYIQTGTSRQLGESDLPRDTLRYFPEGRSKNCYVLPVNTGTTYLLRVRLYPGSASSNESITVPVDFNVTLNSNLWLTYSANSDEERLALRYESIFHSFNRTEAYLCLLKGQNNDPFINAIEMRELNITSYTNAKDEVDPQFMVLVGRVNAGTGPDDITTVSYPDDPYDRIWVPSVLPLYPAFDTVNKSVMPSSGGRAGDGYNWAPNKVLADAWYGEDLSLAYSLASGGPARLYVAFYVQEIRPQVSAEDLQADPVGMLFGVNDQFQELNITSLATNQVTITKIVENDFNFTITTQPWSKYVALLNAYEFYFMDDVDTSTTTAEDRTALNVLQISFQLQDWTGDPCYPVAWDWLTCDPETSRINKLMLSNLNISGSIPEQISTLTELTEIYLDNNDLTGSIPQSMSSLTKLETLALDNNSLSGVIPSTFQDRTGFTFSGNTGLCLRGNTSCESPPSAPAPGQVDSRSAAVKSNSDVFSLKTLLFVCVFTLISTWYDVLL